MYRADVRVGRESHRRNRSSVAASSWSPEIAPQFFGFGRADNMESVTIDIAQSVGLQEESRLRSLASIGILDTEAESIFDAITRLCADYFQADTALLGFADATRVWIKSYWGEAVREVPRGSSIFDLVLARNGPVIVPDVSEESGLEAVGGRLRILQVASFASVPVRSHDGEILGALTVFSRQPRRSMSLIELRMLENLAELVGD